MEENMNQFNENEGIGEVQENNDMNSDILSETQLPKETADENIAEEFAVTSENIESNEQKIYSETINEQEDYSNPFSNEEVDAEDNSSVYNPINYSPVNQVNDYKPMSKGLKVFALIMAAVILLTATSLAGYLVGKNSIKTKTQYRTDLSVDLAAKPAKTDELTAAQVYEKANKYIVGILVYNNSGKSGQASGIIFSEDGYIVTNDHIYSEVPGAKFRIYTHEVGS